MMAKKRESVNGVEHGFTRPPFIRKTYRFTHVDLATVLFILGLVAIAYLYSQGETGVELGDWWIFIVLLLALLNVRFEVEYAKK